ncbi:unnamed protein product [Rotaria sp. Silwood2]|nr:unnamed protein product [Rotaria sp. Silwood2]CAF2525191.1 unnamed protein product [Rotaria sp. Silwood2]CAF2948310.1 unnamed protein product [Rotaria sp. Silwood2]CAF3932370.1 unnamed protein product [Rotaria sp. Silwood2]CAF3953704.1 unnamed protein product [Rotaria sp. Silwood2]
MENLPSSHISTNISNPSPSLFNDNSPSNESRPVENLNWYDDGSIETCIHQTSLQSPSIELREIENDEILLEVDLNGVGDEFFLFSPRNTTDDEPSSSISDDKHEQEFEQMIHTKQMSKRIYTKENKTDDDDDSALFDDFYCASTVEAFGFKTNNNNNNNNNNSSMMITNLDDILTDDYDIDDDDEQNHLKDTSTYLLNTNFRRPIQEDILYEVEHENSFSDNSQHTSSMIIADDNNSMKIDPNLDFLTSAEEPIKTDISQSTMIQTTLQSHENNSLPKQTTTIEYITSPSYILPPIYTTTEKSSSLHIDTSNDTNSYKWESSNYQYPNLSLSSSPSSYTSKIRHRHYSVGSYYDNKTTTVTLHPNHTLYLLGSAPVSPLNRTSTTTCESHYHLHHHSPLSYGTIPLNTFRRVTPYIETNTTLTSNSEYQQSSSLNKTDHNRTIIQPMEQTTIPTTQTVSTSIIPQLISPSSSTHTSSVTFSQYEVPTTVPETILTSPSPPPPPQFEVPLVRPKTSRGRVPILPPPPPPRTTFIEKDQTQTMSLDNDSTSTDNDKTTTINDDLKFIRGTIERVFEHHGESTTSESSTCYEEISDDNNNNDNENDESISLSNSSKTLSKKDNQYPSIEAIQRFYHNKTPSDSEKKTSNKQVTNLDDTPISNHSSTSDKLYSRSNPMNRRKPNLSNSSDNEQATSEEIDDTLNDIEDDDYQDEKLRRQTKNSSSHTSGENSPLHSFNNQTKQKKTLQETQTFQRQEQTIQTTKSASGSQTTIQSYETARSSIPPIDIVTQMVIERNDSIDDGHIGEISGDMIIYYDDIEIVEHSSNISTTESDSISSISKSNHNSKPIESIPPPIPARTLKPSHLLDNQQQLSSTTKTEPINLSTSKINRTYELEKSTIRKKFDVNTVNTMLNSTDYFIGPAITHRLPSARHFAGKINNDDATSRTSTISNTNIIHKPSSTTTMAKSQTLPLQSINTNGHLTNNIQNTSIKNSFSTLPIRAVSSVDTNEKPRSIIADTNALVKQIQNSLSRNSLHDTQIHSPLSISTKDLRTFVSSSYSPSDENMMDDDGVIHVRQQNLNTNDDQSFKRQARLSRSFHNVSEYNSTDQYPKNDNNFTTRTQPSKSVENNLNKVSQNQARNSQILSNFPPVVSSTSFSALPHSEDNARMLSMKWYTGQVSENSEICYNTPHADNDDLLYNYIITHSNREIQLLLARLQSTNDIRIHAALDDIRLRVAQFDASKSPEDLHVFMRYLESRLRDISNKNPSSSSTTTTRTTASNHMNEQRRMSNGTTTSGYPIQQQPDTLSVKSRTSSIVAGADKETPSQRQLGRQHLRSSGSKTTGGGTNGHQLPPPRRGSQSSANQENPAVFDDMLNTVLGLPKKGVPTQAQTSSSSSQNREKTTPLSQTQITTNTTTVTKIGQDVGKRLFESGTYKDPRLIYDGPRKNEKEEQPLETSV